MHFISIREKYTTTFSILRKQLLSKHSTQKLNDPVTDCCEEAEINIRVHYVHYSCGKAWEHSKPKWKLNGDEAARPEGHE